jgi:glycosyltransferase involved in cell wall biosynthesis
MGFRFTPDRHVSFKGKVDDAKKSRLLGSSKGLVFPVLWHEPFGLAIIESLYFGCPVFGTRYGSLPELVNSEVGILSNSESALADALAHAAEFSPATCHEYAASRFDALTMARAYQRLYEKVLNAEYLHTDNPFLPVSEVTAEKRLTMEA